MAFTYDEQKDSRQATSCGYLYERKFFINEDGDIVIESSHGSTYLDEENVADLMEWLNDNFQIKEHESEDDDYE
jgi:hypothetical protein